MASHLHLPRAVNVTLNSAPQTNAGSKGPVHSADTFSALMNLTNLEASPANSVSASADPPMSAWSPNRRSFSVGSSEKHRNRDASKKAEIAPSEGSFYQQSSERLSIQMSAQINPSNYQTTLTGCQGDSTELKPNQQTACAVDQVTAAIGSDAGRSALIPMQERGQPSAICAQAPAAAIQPERGGASPAATVTSSGKPAQAGAAPQPHGNTASAKPVGADVQTETDGENGFTELLWQDAQGTIVAGQALSPSIQAADLKSEMFGAETNKSGTDLQDNSKGKPTTDLFPISTQPAAKTESNDKGSRAQQKAAFGFGLATSAQTLSVLAGQVKQVAMIDKADNSLAQNSPAQTSFAVSTTSTNVTGDAFKALPAPDNTAHLPMTPDSAHPLPEVNATSPLGSVQTAHLVQQLSESQLRVGIQAGEFGKIDIHASITQSQISARIYFEHDELGKVLAGGLPQLHEKLSGEHRMDAQIELYNTGSSHSNGTDRQQQHQQQRTPEQNGPASRDAEEPTPKVETLQEPTATTGLDMHV